MSDDDLITELLHNIDGFRCVHRKLHEMQELSMSDMLVFGAVLHSEQDNLPPPKMSDIARHANLSTAAISQIAAQLEKKQLVERYSAPGDRRTVYVRITPAGKKVFADEGRRCQEIMRQAVQKLGTEKSRQFLALSEDLQHIIREIEV